jgi:hypothetical protein
MRWGKGEPPSPAISTLYDAVVAFRKSSRSGWTALEIGLEMINLRRIQDVLDLSFAEMSSEFSRTEEAERWGAAGDIDWIRHECRMTGTAALDRVTTGQQMHRLPESVQAVAEGDIGFGHLAQIARTTAVLQRSPVGEGFDEELLVDRARQCTVGKFWYFCEKLRHAADPDAVADEQRASAEQRYLKLSPHEDGSLSFRGWFDSVAGAAFRTALEPLARPTGAEDDRRKERRLADALDEIVEWTLDSGRLPQHGGQRPHLQVTATLEALQGIQGAPAADLQFSRPISYRTVERLACDATISRVLINARSMVTDVGRATRVITGPTRRALETRDGGCRWPGCDRPASHSAGHHLQHWASGGATRLENLMLLCHRHHWMVHEGGWQLVPTDEGFTPIPPPLAYGPGARAPDEWDAA